MPWADRSSLEHAALDYCVPHGIPLSVFLGRVVGLGEPQWTHDDRQAVFDWLAEQARHCPDCGADEAEAMKRENTFAYEAKAFWCHGCRAIHRASVALAGPGAKENPQAGSRYRLIHVPQERDDNGRVELAK